MVNPRFVAIKVHNAEGASSQDLFTSNTVEVFDEQSILLVYNDGDLPRRKF